MLHRMISKCLEHPGTLRHAKSDIDTERCGIIYFISVVLALIMCIHPKLKKYFAGQPRWYRQLAHYLQKIIYITYNVV